MSELLLTIGNKNYSSWSLRPWILLKHLGLAFAERLIPLDTPEFARDIATISPTRACPGAAARSLADLGFAGHLRIRLRARGPRLARRARRTRRSACRLRRDARRLQHPAFTMAHECARAGRRHGRQSGTVRRHRAHRRPVGRLPRPVRRRRALVVRRIQRGRCHVRARGAAPSHLRRATCARVLGAATCATVLGRYAHARLARGGRGRELDRSKLPKLVDETERTMKKCLSIVALVCASLPCPRWPPTPRVSFTPRDLNALARVSDPQVSPDGRYVVYVQRETDFDANRGRNDLWLVDLEAAESRSRAGSRSTPPTTRTRAGRRTAAASTSSPRAPAPRRSGACRFNGGEAVQITDYPLDIGTFGFSGDGERMARVHGGVPRLRRSQVHARSPRCRRQEPGLGAQLRPAVRAPLGHLGQRHAQQPVRGAVERRRPGRCAAERVARPRRGRALEALGGGEEYTFTPDGSRIVFSARVAGREEAWSTNFDLYEVFRVLASACAAANLTPTTRPGTRNRYS